MQTSNHLFTVAGKLTRKISFCIIAAWLLSTCQLMAQQADAPQKMKPRFGIKGGINIASVSFDGSGSNDLDTDSKIGFVGGLTVDFPVMPQMFIHSGLEASMKGFELELTNGRTLDTKAIYLQIPVEIGYAFGIGKDWQLEPRFGFYAAYGVGGKSKVSGSSESVKTFGDEILKKFDYGFGGGFYFIRNKFIGGLHIERSLGKVNGDNLRVTGAKTHNINVSFTAGYVF